VCFACDPVDPGGLVTADPYTVVQVYGARFIPGLAKEQRANLKRAQALLCHTHFTNYSKVVEELEKACLPEGEVHE